MTANNIQTQGHVRVHVATIQPDQADAIVRRTLERNANFRSPYNKGNGGLVHQALQYADAMTSGRWRWRDADLIRLSSDWQTCSNGMHRLAACAKSGIPLQCLVLADGTYAAGTESDRGRNRTISQILTNADIPNAGVTAAAARAILQRSVSEDLGLSVGHAALYVHVDDVVDLVRKFEGDLVHVNPKSAWASSHQINSSAYVAFLFVLASQFGRDVADDFHSEMSDRDIDPSHPFRAMRIAAVTHYERHGKRWPFDLSFNSLTKAYNTALEGRTLKMWKAPVWSGVHWPTGVDPSIYRLRDYGSDRGQS